MKLKQLVTLTSVLQYNLLFIILFFGHPSYSSEKGESISVFAQDTAVARFGKEVVFSSELELFKNNILKLKCIENKGLLFKFSKITIKDLTKVENFKKRSEALEEMIILKKAISFSNDFNTLDKDSRLNNDLRGCSLPSYDQWSHTLKEIISFEIYLRDRFISENQKINNNFKKVLASFRGAIVQRDNHEWLIP
jgi:hypothetical protein